MNSNSKTSFLSRKSYDLNEDGGATSRHRHGSDGASRRRSRRSSVSRKYVIEELKKDNEILKQKLRITEKYARDIEEHFQEQVHALMNSLGRPPQLNQVDTEGTIMRSSDSFTGTMLYKS